MEPFIGTVLMFAGNFAPRGWALCNGQLLAISSHSALFSILGTTYGGDGVSTFGLPELRGRAAIHEGTGPGLTPRPLGQRSGAEAVTLTTNQIPSHNHSISAHNDAASTREPSSNALAQELIYNSRPPNAMLDPQTIGNTGAGQSHDNMQPYLVLNFIIALEGLYPSRS